jgi:hypothetical protein
MEIYTNASSAATRKLCRDLETACIATHPQVGCTPRADVSTPNHHRFAD